MSRFDPTLREIRSLDRAVQDRAFTLIFVLRAQLGLPAVIVEGFRPQARQDRLFAQGRTRPGPIVTFARVSRHTSRRAFDIVFRGVRPDDAVRAGWFRAAGIIGERLGLRWGGRFRRLKDFGHFEG
ncbi:MAG: M15 family metallopeptidase [Acidiferrobacterales bacterium]